MKITEILHENRPGGGNDPHIEEAVINRIKQAVNGMSALDTAYLEGILGALNREYRVQIDLSVFPGDSTVHFAWRNRADFFIVKL